MLSPTETSPDVSTWTAEAKQHLELYELTKEDAADEMVCAYVQQQTAQLSKFSLFSSGDKNDEEAGRSCQSNPAYSTRGN